MQRRGLRQSIEAADRHIIVAIDDDIDDDSVHASVVDASTLIAPFHAPGPHLPLAAARNIGARLAIDDGAQLLVFLDVDCIPAPNMLSRYHCAASNPAYRDGLLCGPVTYLPPPAPDGYDLDGLSSMINPHPDRPSPSDDEVIANGDHELFWSLSFAVKRSTWQRIGGFSTQYQGYGGEDTDFGQIARSQGISLHWVGGAHAFHQFHVVSDPPMEHLHDIVANAAVFHRRWGWWPMGGWLDAFQREGLISRDDEGHIAVL
jgi:GT2 family glycosyltransferase